MSKQNSTSSHGRKRKWCDAGHVGNRGKKEARVSDSPDILSHAPESVKIADFVENRAAEIIALTSHVEKIGGTKLISQRLPRHMRRRALSHDIRRLPKRLREAAAKEIERASATKRPSRKHRRRPKNLMSDYQRRQRRITWLETHIWHAKRFHMIDKWGYRLADHPNDKSMRACHRAADKYCLLQDVSFECCVEVTGTEEVIRQCLKHMVSEKTGATLLGKQYMNGSKWGETVMFACDQYPRGAIGTVSFLWRPPPSDKESPERTLWIWSHPASFELIWEQLKQSIKLQLGCSREPDLKKKELEKENEKKTEKPESNNVSSNKMSDTSENGGKCNVKSDVKNLEYFADGIKLRSLKDVMNKFRLTGQTTQAILSEVLQSSDITVRDQPGSQWWQKYYAENTIHKGSDQKLCSDWLKCHQSPAEAPPFQVIALTVRDPRLLLPPKRNKVMPPLEVPQIQPLPDDINPDSPLWEEGIREEVKTSKMADHLLNKRREENLVPGTPISLGIEESRIPVLLLQRPGYRNTISFKSRGRGPPKSIHQGFGCGWDVIVPPGWGTAFHIAFVFRGCRVGGLREAHAVSREAGRLTFPVDYPDTPAGRMYAMEQRDELQRKYERNPPAKRPNYVKLGIQDPFICSWSTLVEEWKHSSDVNSDSEQFFVLRDLHVLKLLSEALVYEQSAESSLSRLEAFPFKSELEKLVLANASSLVPVRITMHCKGVPCQFAHVCVPNVDDFENLKQESEVRCPSEPKHADPEGDLRRKEKKLKKKSKKSKVVNLKSALSDPSNPVEAALAKMLQVKPSEQPFTETDCKSPKTKLISSTSRQIFGFVSDGDFSLGQGQGHGKAFCSLLGLIELLKRIPVNKPCLTLVRNISSCQYRFAWISVL